MALVCIVPRPCQRQAVRNAVHTLTSLAPYRVCVPAQLCLMAASFASFSLSFSAPLVEKLRIDASRGMDAVEKPFEVLIHGNSCSLWIVCFDRGHDRLMLGDHLCDPSPLRQRQPPVAVDMDFHLLDQSPAPGMPSDLSDAGVKRLVRLMEGFTIPGGFSFPLTFQGRTQRQNLAGRGTLGR